MEYYFKIIAKEDNQVLFSSLMHGLNKVYHSKELAQGIADILLHSIFNSGKYYSVIEPTDIEEIFKLNDKKDLEL